MNARKTGIALAAALVGLGAGWLWSRWRLRPRAEAATRRYETSRDVLTLYGLQKRYRALHGAYADGLDALLSVSDNGAAFKASMARHLDLSTLAVVGGRDRFRIEANALDGLRTLVKIEGPIRDRPAPRAAPPVLPAESPDASLDSGAPIRR